jgi:hypothetical protein
MGGSKGGGKPPKQDNSMAMMMAMMQAQQQAAQQAAAEAARAQREAALAAENQAAEQRMTQSQQAAVDTLKRMESMQSLEDASKKTSYQKEQEAAGLSATGGGYDINAARNAALANLGAASTTLPATAANLAANPQLTNPAMTTAGSLNQGSGGSSQRSNLFTLPNTKNLVFGGA